MLSRDYEDGREKVDAGSISEEPTDF